MTNTFVGVDGKQRCSWCSATEDYIAYHDHGAFLFLMIIVYLRKFAWKDFNLG